MGTGTHLGIEKFDLADGINATHVPARGSDAIADTIANVIARRTDYALSPILTTLPYNVAGRLVPLGVSRARRSSALAHVPTLAKAGVSGFDFPIWYGISAAGPLQPESFRSSPRTSRVRCLILLCAPRS